MRTKRAVCLAVLTIAVAIGAARAEDPPTERILLPVYTTEPVAGVNGSSWITDFHLSNSGDDTVEVGGIWWECFLPECGNLPAPVEAGVTFRPQVQESSDGLNGVLLYANAVGASDLDLGLRFRDLSRQATTWGTELPTPRESEFRSDRISLVDVPVTDHFRQTLRIYEMDGTERLASVRVKIFRLDPSHDQPHGDPDALLGEAEVPLRFAPPFAVPPYHPGYAVIPDFSTIAPLGDAESLRIEIEPATEGLKLWAFVTVIHNESQHATVITPQ